MSNFARISNPGSNMTIIYGHDGDTLYVSYETIVAAFVSGIGYRTEKKYSVTTSKHINKMRVGHLPTLPQTEFEQFVKGFRI